VEAVLLVFEGAVVGLVAVRRAEAPVVAEPRVGRERVEVGILEEGVVVDEVGRSSRRRARAGGAIRRR
jgi:hypothetical protein